MSRDVGDADRAQLARDEANRMRRQAYRGQIEFAPTSELVEALRVMEIFTPTRRRETVARG